MTDKQFEIMTNIIGGVESGGQIYGNRRYGAYAAKAANDPNEKTCTLGWAQNYGNEGRRLCRMILQSDPAAFRKADTAGIEAKLQVDWEKTRWDPSNEEKQALIAIITTDAGKVCQDQLFVELMEEYIDQAEKYGVSDIKAQMMWCEIEHLGGIGPVKRIFGRAKKPYTPENIYASLLLDQQDTSCNNQVGDKKFQTRHQCCVLWINKYVTGSVTESEGNNMGVTAQQIIDIMEGWMGLSRANGTHKPIIDIYNSHKPLARGYEVKYTDDYCDTTVSAAFIKAGAVDLIGGTECGVEEHISKFKKAGIWNEDGTITPEPGYIVCYNWDDATQPNDGWADHIGVVKEVNKKAGEFTVSEGNMSGGKVGHRTIKIGWGYIRGFACPKYSKASSGSSATTGGSSASGSASTATSSSGKIGSCSVTLHTFLVGAEDPQVKAIQLILNKLGYKGKDGKTLTVDGSLGTNTAYAITAFQKANGMKNINFGTVAAKTWTLLLSAL